jgi:hypothetical protein
MGDVEPRSELHTSTKLLRVHMWLGQVLEMGRYMPVYHTGIFFVPEFHTDT